MLLTLVVLALALPPANAPADKPVARIGTRAVTHSEIACSPLDAKQHADTCLRNEQLNLDYLIIRARLREAVRINHIAVSPAETEAVARGPAERSAALSRAMALAGLAMLDGQSQSAVDAKILKPAGIPEEAFAAFYARLHTRDALLNYMKTHDVASLMRATQAGVEDSLAIKKLEQLVGDRAVRQGEPERIVIQRLIDEATASLGGIVILDQRFHMPKLIVEPSS